MLTWWALAAAAVVLLVGTVVTARRPVDPVPDRGGYFDRWQGLHGGYDPRASRMVAGWLTAAFVVARPLARAGAQPDVLTLWTVWLACMVVALSAEGGGWTALAGLLVVLGGLGDAVDGAVAALTDRATRWGYVLDSLADRVADLLYVAALGILGAPGWLVAATGFGILLLEYVRARAGNAGAGEIGTITVGERASRVLAAAVTLIAAGVAPEEEALLATLGAGVLAVLTLAGLVQLLVAVRRSLAAPQERGS